MSKFEVGQKVRVSERAVISRQGVEYVAAVGDHGTVVEVDTEGETDPYNVYAVVVAGIPAQLWYHEAQLSQVVTTEEILNRIADTLDKLLEQGKPAEVIQTLYASGEITSEMLRRSNGLGTEPVKGEVKRKIKDLKVGDEFIEYGPIREEGTSKHEFGTQPIYSIKYLQNNIIELFRGDDTRFWIGHAEDEVRVYVG